MLRIAIGYILTLFVCLLVGPQAGMAADYGDAMAADLPIVPGQPINAKAGSLGNLAKMKIQGATTFSADAIRTALGRDLNVRLAAHPASPLGVLVAELEYSLLTGYRYAGFPEAKATVRYDDADQCLSLSIVEGPRFRAGAVRIEGTKTMPVARLVARMTTRYPPQDAVARSFRNEADQATVQWVDRNGQEVSLLSPVWETGEPARLEASLLGGRRDTAPSLLSEQTREALADLGYYFPRFSLRVDLDEKTSLADLVVIVEEEGPSVIIGTIELTGNQVNTREKVLDLLQIKPGDSLTRETLIDINRRLWLSGRFAACNATPVAPASEDDKILLRIDLVEYPKATPLGQPLTQEEQIMLRLRDWMADARHWPSDLVWSYRQADATLTAAVSPEQGACIQIRDAKGLWFDCPIDNAVVVSREEIGLYATERKLVASRGPWQGTLNLALRLSEDFAGSDKPFCFSFSLGATSRDEKHLPFLLYLDMQPAVFVAQLYEHKVKTSLHDGFLDGVYRQEGSTTSWRVEADSGRLLEFVVASSEDGAADAKNEVSSPASDAPWTLRVTCEKGVYDRLVAGVHENAGDAFNAFDPARPASSTLAFFCDEPWLAKMVKSQAGDLPVLPILHRMLDRNIAAPLDHLFVGEKDAAPGFGIPRFSQDGFRSYGLAESMTCFGLLLNDKLFPYVSWPWTVCHESGMAAIGKTQYATAELFRFTDASDSGPLCLLAWSAMFQASHPRAAAIIARQGINRLSAERFVVDCRPLLSDDHLVGKCVRRAADAFRALNEQEVAMLGMGLSPENAKYLAECERILRAAPDKPLDEALPELIETLWKAGWDKRIEAALQSIQANGTQGPPEAI